MRSISRSVANPPKLFSTCALFPDEVWLQVFEYEGFAKSTITQLMLVCKRWKAIATPLLYRATSLFSQQSIGDLNTHLACFPERGQWINALTIITSYRDPDSVVPLLCLTNRLRVVTLGMHWISASELYVLRAKHAETLRCLDVFCLGEVQRESSHLSFTRTLAILSAFPFLQELYLDVTQLPSNLLQDISVDLIEIPSIMKLVISTDAEEGFLLPLGSFRFPSLEQVCLKDPQAPPIVAYTSLRSFLLAHPHILRLDLHLCRPFYEMLFKGEAILAEDLTLYDIGGWNLPTTFSFPNRVKTLNIPSGNTKTSDSDPWVFLTSLLQHCPRSLRTICFQSLRWHERRNTDNAKAQFLGHISSYALRFGNQGIKVVDMDGMKLNSSPHAIE